MEVDVISTWDEADTETHRLGVIALKIPAPARREGSKAFRWIRRIREHRLLRRLARKAESIADARFGSGQVRVQGVGISRGSITVILEVLTVLAPVYKFFKDYPKLREGFLLFVEDVRHNGAAFESVVRRHLGTRAHASQAGAGASQQPMDQTAGVSSRQVVRPPRTTSDRIVNGALRELGVAVVAVLAGALAYYAADLFGSVIVSVVGAAIFRAAGVPDEGLQAQMTVSLPYLLVGAAVDSGSAGFGGLVAGAVGNDRGALRGAMVGVIAVVSGIAEVMWWPTVFIAYPFWLNVLSFGFAMVSATILGRVGSDAE